MNVMKVILHQCEKFPKNNDFSSYFFLEKQKTLSQINKLFKQMSRCLASFQKVHLHNEYLQKWIPSNTNSFRYEFKYERIRARQKRFTLKGIFKLFFQEFLRCLAEKSADKNLLKRKICYKITQPCLQTLHRGRCILSFLMTNIVILSVLQTHQDYENDFNLIMQRVFACTFLFPELF